MTDLTRSSPYLSARWMCWLVLVAGLCLMGAAQARSIEAKPMPYELPSWFKSSFLDIPQDARDAGQAGKQLMIFFHLEDCPFCANLLKDNFTSGPNKAALQKRFDVIAINVRGDLPVQWLDGQSLTEKELAKKLNVFATPLVMVISPQGKVTKTIHGYKAPEAFFKALGLGQ